MMLSRGRLAQLVRAPPLQGGGHRFESCTAHLSPQPDPDMDRVDVLAACTFLADHFDPSSLLGREGYNLCVVWSLCYEAGVEAGMLPTVIVTHIAKAFGPVQAVRDVSFEVYPGEIFGLLGPNGAGKTTTIRVMLDILKPDRGKVAIFDGPVTETKKAHIGYLPEERGLYQDAKLEETLIYLAMLKGLGELEARNRLQVWLERFDLWEHRHKKVRELSRGMQQKAQLIVTLVHDPALIIVDEPFSGLDPVNTRLVKDIILDEARAGKTVIMSTHQMFQVEALCTRIILINEGETVLYGTVNELRRQFAGNAVTIEGSGNFADLPGVIEARRHNGAWHLTLAPDVTPQRLLQAVAAAPDCEVLRFEVAQASLEDIFVRVVQKGLPAGERNHA